MQRPQQFPTRSRACAPAGPADRRGLTLVELLVVVAIVVMVSAALVPMIGSAMQNREIRESCRMLNSFFAAAQAQAIAEDRTVGIWLERAANNPESCYQVYRAEVPPPYSGDFLGARATIAPAGGTPWTATATLSAAGSLTRLVTVGDTIRFGFQGHAYPITAVSTGQVTFTRPPSAPFAIVPQSGVEGVSYQIFRKPRKSSLRSIELPVPACIDLQQSGLGVDPGNSLFTLPASAAYGQAPIIITFAPNGSMQYVYYGDTQPARPMAPVHLMIGKSDQLGPGNLIDGNTLWVSVGQANGLVTTAPNTVKTAADGSLVPPTISSARELAQQAQSLGGK